MKRFLSALITTCLWALAITQVLITRCLIPALQLLLMLLQEAAAATPPEPQPVGQTTEPEGFTDQLTDHAPVNQAAFVRNFKAARRKQMSRAGRANTKVAS